MTAGGIVILMAGAVAVFGVAALVMILVFDRCHYCRRIVRYRTWRPLHYGVTDLYGPRCRRSFYDGKIITVEDKEGS